MTLKKHVKELVEKNYLFFILIRTLYGYLFWYANKLTNYYFEKKEFYNTQGYEVDLNNPESFNERIMKKKLYKRNHLIERTSDKYEVRSYIKDILGEKADQHLIPLLQVVENPNNIRFEDLPDDFIMKANHASGWNKMVRNNEYDEKEIRNTCRKWLNTPYGLEKIEWSYQKLDRRVIFEKLLKDDDGKVPTDFKFFTFNGKVKLIQVDVDRFTNPRRTLYREDWTYVDATIKYPRGPKHSKPHNLDEMIELAETLGKPFEFVRVDLYTINNDIYVGELTHFPASGRSLFDPQDFDHTLGEIWRNTTTKDTT